MGRLLPYKALVGLAIFTIVFLKPNNAAPVQETADGRFPDAKGCFFDQKHFPSGHVIDTNDKCRNCTCVDDTFMCYTQVCPYVKISTMHCKSVHHEGDCCPKYWCIKGKEDHIMPTEEPETKGCYVNGFRYDEGARIPMDLLKPCDACYCVRNTSICTLQICKLDIDGCFPEFKVGSCCPSRYNCTDEAATTVPPGIMEAEEYKGCKHEGVFYRDGDQVPSSDKCKQCYCMKHQVVCTTERCTPPAPNCEPIVVTEGECCPQKYDCPAGTEIPDFGTTHIVTTAEEFLLATSTQMPRMTTMVTEDLSSVKETPSEYEVAFPTTKAVRRMEDEEETVAQTEIAEDTDMISRPRIPKITEVPDSMFTTQPTRRVPVRPTFFANNTIPGEGFCFFMNRTYKNGEQFVVDDPCIINCTCLNSDVKCKKVECTFVRPENGVNCKARRKPGECCYEYVCDMPSTLPPKDTQQPVQQTMLDAFDSTPVIQQQETVAFESTTKSETSKVKEMDSTTTGEFTTFKIVKTTPVVETESPLTVLENVTLKATITESTATLQPGLSTDQSTIESLETEQPDRKTDFVQVYTETVSKDTEAISSITTEAKTTLEETKVTPLMITTEEKQIDLTGETLESGVSTVEDTATKPKDTVGVTKTTPEAELVTIHTIDSSASKSETVEGTSTISLTETSDNGTTLADTSSEALTSEAVTEAATTSTTKESTYETVSSGITISKVESTSDIVTEILKNTTLSDAFSTETSQTLVKTTTPAKEIKTENESIIQTTDILSTESEWARPELTTVTSSTLMDKHTTERELKLTGSDETVATVLEHTQTSTDSESLLGSTEVGSVKPEIQTKIPEDIKSTHMLETETTFLEISKTDKISETTKEFFTTEEALKEISTLTSIKEKPADLELESTITSQFETTEKDLETIKDEKTSVSTEFISTSESISIKTEESDILEETTTPVVKVFTIESLDVEEELKDIRTKPESATPISATKDHFAETEKVKGITEVYATDISATTPKEMSAFTEIDIGTTISDAEEIATVVDSMSESDKITKDHDLESHPTSEVKSSTQKDLPSTKYLESEIKTTTKLDAIETLSFTPEKISTEKISSSTETIETTEQIDTKKFSQTPEDMHKPFETTSTLEPTVVETETTAYTTLLSVEPSTAEQAITFDTSTISTKAETPISITTRKVEPTTLKPAISTLKVTEAQSTFESTFESTKPSDMTTEKESEFDADVTHISTQTETEKAQSMIPSVEYSTLQILTIASTDKADSESKETSIITSTTTESKTEKIITEDKLSTESITHKHETSTTPVDSGTISETKPSLSTIKPVEGTDITFETSTFKPQHATETKPKDVTAFNELETSSIEPKHTTIKEPPVEEIDKWRHSTPSDLSSTEEDISKDTSPSLKKDILTSTSSQTYEITEDTTTTHEVEIKTDYSRTEMKQTPESLIRDNATLPTADLATTIVSLLPEITKFEGFTEVEDKEETETKKQETDMHPTTTFHPATSEIKKDTVTKLIPDEEKASTKPKIHTTESSAITTSEGTEMITTEKMAIDVSKQPEKAPEDETTDDIFKTSTLSQAEKISTSSTDESQESTLITKDYELRKTTTLESKDATTATPESELVTKKIEQTDISLLDTSSTLTSTQRHETTSFVDETTITKSFTANITEGSHESDKIPDLLVTTEQSFSDSETSDSVIRVTAEDISTSATYSTKLKEISDSTTQKILEDELFASSTLPKDDESKIDIDKDITTKEVTETPFLTKGTSTIADIQRINVTTKLEDTTPLMEKTDPTLLAETISIISTDDMMKSTSDFLDKKSTLFTKSTEKSLTTKYDVSLETTTSKITKTDMIDTSMNVSADSSTEVPFGTDDGKETTLIADTTISLLNTSEKKSTSLRPETTEEISSTSNATYLSSEIPEKEQTQEIETSTLSFITDALSFIKTIFTTDSSITIAEEKDISEETEKYPSITTHDEEKTEIIYKSTEQELDLNISDVTLTTEPETLSNATSFTTAMKFEIHPRTSTKQMTDSSETDSEIISSTSTDLRDNITISTIKPIIKVTALGEKTSPITEKYFTEETSMDAEVTTFAMRISTDDAETTYEISTEKSKETSYLSNVTTSPDVTTLSVEISTGTKPESTKLPLITEISTISIPKEQISNISTTIDSEKVHKISTPLSEVSETFEDKETTSISTFETEQYSRTSSDEEISLPLSTTSELFDTTLRQETTVTSISDMPVDQTVIFTTLPKLGVETTEQLLHATNASETELTKTISTESTLLVDKTDTEQATVSDKGLLTTASVIDEQNITTMSTEPSTQRSVEISVMESTTVSTSKETDKILEEKVKTDLLSTTAQSIPISTQQSMEMDNVTDILTTEKDLLQTMVTEDETQEEIITSKIDQAKDKEISNVTLSTIASDVTTAHTLKMEFSSSISDISGETIKEISDEKTSTKLPDESLVTATEIKEYIGEKTSGAFETTSTDEKISTVTDKTELPEIPTILSEKTESETAGTITTDMDVLKFDTETEKTPADVLEQTSEIDLIYKSTAFDLKLSTIETEQTTMKSFSYAPKPTEIITESKVETDSITTSKSTEEDKFGTTGEFSTTKKSSEEISTSIKPSDSTETEPTAAQKDKTEHDSTYSETDSADIVTYATTQRDIESITTSTITDVKTDPQVTFSETPTKLEVIADSSTKLLTTGFPVDSTTELFPISKITTLKSESTSISAETEHTVIKEEVIPRNITFSSDSRVLTTLPTISDSEDITFTTKKSLTSEAASTLSTTAVPLHEISETHVPQDVTTKDLIDIPPKPDTILPVPSTSKSDKETTVDKRTTTEIPVTKISTVMKSTDKSTVTESTSSTATTVSSELTTKVETTLKPILTTDFISKGDIPETAPTTEQHLSEEEDDCIFNGIIYKDSEKIIPMNPCEECFCSSGTMICSKIICKEPQEGCILISNKTSDCCANYQCPEEVEETSHTTTAVEQKVTDKDVTTVISKTFMTTPTPSKSTMTTMKLDEPEEILKEVTTSKEAETATDKSVNITKMTTDISATTEKIQDDTIPKFVTKQSHDTSTGSVFKTTKQTETEQDFETSDMATTSIKYSDKEPQSTEKSHIDKEITSPVPVDHDLMFTSKEPFDTTETEKTTFTAEGIVTDNTLETLASETKTTVTSEDIKTQDITEESIKPSMSKIPIQETTDSTITTESIASTKELEPISEVSMAHEVITTDEKHLKSTIFKPYNESTSETTTALETEIESKTTRLAEVDITPKVNESELTEKTSDIEGFTSVPHDKETTSTLEEQQSKVTLIKKPTTATAKDKITTTEIGELYSPAEKTTISSKDDEIQETKPTTKYDIYISTTEKVSELTDKPILAIEETSTTVDKDFTTKSKEITDSTSKQTATTEIIKDATTLESEEISKDDITIATKGEETEDSKQGVTDITQSEKDMKETTAPVSDKKFVTAKDVLPTVTDITMSSTTVETEISTIYEKLSKPTTISSHAEITKPTSKTTESVTTEFLPKVTMIPEMEVSTRVDKDVTTKFEEITESVTKETTTPKIDKYDVTTLESEEISEGDITISTKVAEIKDITKQGVTETTISEKEMKETTIPVSDKEISTSKEDGLPTAVDATTSRSTMEAEISTKYEKLSKPTTLSSHTEITQPRKTTESLTTEFHPEITTISDTEASTADDIHLTTKQETITKSTSEDSTTEIIKDITTHESEEISNGTITISTKGEEIEGITELIVTETTKAEKEMKETTESVSDKTVITSKKDGLPTVTEATIASTIVESEISTIHDKISKSTTSIPHTEITQPTSKTAEFQPKVTTISEMEVSTTVDKDIPTKFDEITERITKETATPEISKDVTTLESEEISEGDITITTEGAKTEDIMKQGVTTTTISEIEIKETTSPVSETEIPTSKEDVLSTVTDVTPSSSIMELEISTIHKKLPKPTILSLHTEITQPTSKTTESVLPKVTTISKMEVTETIGKELTTKFEEITESITKETSTPEIIEDATTLESEELSKGDIIITTEGEKTEYITKEGVPETTKSEKEIKETTAPVSDKKFVTSKEDALPTVTDVTKYSTTVETEISTIYEKLSKPTTLSPHTEISRSTSKITESVITEFQPKVTTISEMEVSTTADKGLTTEFEEITESITKETATPEISKDAITLESEELSKGDITVTTEGAKTEYITKGGEPETTKSEKEIKATTAPISDKEISTSKEDVLPTVTQLTSETTESIITEFQPKVTPISEIAASTTVDKVFTTKIEEITESTPKEIATGISEGVATLKKEEISKEDITITTEGAKTEDITKQEVTVTTKSEKEMKETTSPVSDKKFIGSTKDFLPTVTDVEIPSTTVETEISTIHEKLSKSTTLSPHTEITHSTSKATESIAEFQPKVTTISEMVSTIAFDKEFTTDYKEITDKTSKETAATKIIEDVTTLESEEISKGDITIATEGAKSEDITKQEVTVTTVSDKETKGTTAMVSDKEISTSKEDVLSTVTVGTTSSSTVESEISTTHKQFSTPTTLSLHTEITQPTSKTTESVLPKVTTISEMEVTETIGKEVTTKFEEITESITKETSTPKVSEDATTLESEELSKGDITITTEGAKTEYITKEGVPETTKSEKEIKETTAPVSDKKFVTSKEDVLPTETMSSTTMETEISTISEKRSKPTTLSPHTEITMPTSETSESFITEFQPKVTTIFEMETSTTVDKDLTTILEETTKIIAKETATPQISKDDVTTLKSEEISKGDITISTKGEEFENITEQTVTETTKSEKEMKETTKPVSDKTFVTSKDVLPTTAEVATSSKTVESEISTIYEKLSKPTTLSSPTESTQPRSKTTEPVSTEFQPKATTTSEIDITLSSKESEITDMISTVNMTSSSVAEDLDSVTKGISDVFSSEFTTGMSKETVSEIDITTIDKEVVLTEKTPLTLILTSTSIDEQSQYASTTVKSTDIISSVMTSTALDKEGTTEFDAEGTDATKKEILISTKDDVQDFVKQTVTKSVELEGKATETTQQITDAEVETYFESDTPSTKREDIENTSTALEEDFTSTTIKSTAITSEETATEIAKEIKTLESKEISVGETITTAKDRDIEDITMQTLFESNETEEHAEETSVTEFDKELTTSKEARFSPITEMLTSDISIERNQTTIYEILSKPTTLASHTRLSTRLISEPTTSEFQPKTEIISESDTTLLDEVTELTKNVSVEEITSPSVEKDIASTPMQTTNITSGEKASSALVTESYSSAETEKASTIKDMIFTTETEDLRDITTITEADKFKKPTETITHPETIEAKEFTLASTELYRTFKPKIPTDATLTKETTTTLTVDRDTMTEYSKEDPSKTDLPIDLLDESLQNVTKLTTETPSTFDTVKTTVEGTQRDKEDTTTTLKELTTPLLKIFDKTDSSETDTDTKMTSTLLPISTKDHDKTTFEKESEESITVQTTKFKNTTVQESEMNTTIQDEFSTHITTSPSKILKADDEITTIIETRFESTTLSTEHVEAVEEGKITDRVFSTKNISSTELTTMPTTKETKITPKEIDSEFDTEIYVSSVKASSFTTLNETSEDETLKTMRSSPATSKFPALDLVTERESTGLPKTTASLHIVSETVPVITESTSKDSLGEITDFTSSTSISKITTSSPITTETDFEIVTEVIEANKSFTSLDKGGTVKSTPRKEIESSTITIPKETSEDTTPLAVAETSQEYNETSLTDSIFSFVSTRFTDMTKGVQEITTIDIDKEQQSTIEEEATTMSTFELSTRKTEERLIPLTRRIDMDIEKQITEDQTSQDGETTMSHILDSSTDKPRAKTTEIEITTDIQFNATETSEIDVTSRIETNATIKEEITHKPTTDITEEITRKLIKDITEGITTSPLVSLFTHEKTTVSETLPSKIFESDVTTQSLEFATDLQKTSERDKEIRTDSTTAWDGKFTTDEPKLASDTMFTSPTFIPTEEIKTTSESREMFDTTKFADETKSLTKSSKDQTDVPFTDLEKASRATRKDMESETTTVSFSETEVISSTTDMKETERNLTSETELGTSVSLKMKPSTATDKVIPEKETSVSETEPTLSKEITTSSETATKEVETTAADGEETVSVLLSEDRTTSPDMIKTALPKITPEADSLSLDKKTETLITSTTTETIMNGTTEVELKASATTEQLKDTAVNITDLSMPTLETDSRTVSTIIDAIRTASQNITTTILEKTTTTMMDKTTLQDLDEKEKTKDFMTTKELEELPTTITSTNITEKEFIDKVSKSAEATPEITESTMIQKTETLSTTESEEQPSSTRSITEEKIASEKLETMKTTVKPISSTVITTSTDKSFTTQSPSDVTSSETFSTQDSTFITPEEAKGNATEMLTKGFKAIETTPVSFTTRHPSLNDSDTTVTEEDDYLLDETNCYYQGRMYLSAEQIPRNDPCEFCFCFRSNIICLQQSCPPPATNCEPTKIPGFCCPRYECPVYLTSKNMTQLTRRKGATPIIIHQKRIDKREIRPTIEVKGCQVNGTFYELGKTVTSASGPCLHCACQEDGIMHCDPQRCKPQPPLMLKMNNSFFKRR